MLGLLKEFFWIYDLKEKTLISMLKDIDIFEGLSDSQLYKFSKQFKLKKYDINSIIIRQWEKPSFIWLLESWEIEVYRQEEDKSIKLWIISSWEIFWEMSFLNNTVAMASLITSRNCIAWEVSAQDMRQILDNYQNIKAKMLIIIERRQKNNANSFK